MKIILECSLNSMPSSSPKHLSTTVASVRQCRDTSKLSVKNVEYALTLPNHSMIDSEKLTQIQATREIVFGLPSFSTALIDWDPREHYTLAVNYTAMLSFDSLLSKPNLL